MMNIKFSSDKKYFQLLEIFLFKESFRYNSFCIKRGGKKMIHKTLKPFPKDFLWGARDVYKRQLYDISIPYFYIYLKN